jgi:hypothetical protein
MKRSAAWFCLCYALSLLPQAQAQGLQSCKRDYSALRQPSYTQTEDIQAGSVLYLSPTYLEALDTGRFGSDSAGIMIYEYVRPASRQEIRSGKVEDHPREIVAEDGNIYFPRKVAPDVHFFWPLPSFRGDYMPHWEDPDLVLPPGLSPLDVSLYREAPLEVIQVSPFYLLLKSGGKQIVFYRGYPRMETVFLSEQARTALASKRSLAEALKGKRLLVDPKMNVSRSDDAQREQSLPQDAFEVLISGVRVTPLHVHLGYGPGEQDTLRAGKESAFELYDPACIQSLRKEMSHEARTQAEAQEEALQALLKAGRPEGDSLLAALLFPRFQRVSQAQGPDLYEYLPLSLPEDSLGAWIEARLDSEGACYLRSRLVSPKGLYHTRLILYAGADSLYSNRVPTLDPRNQRKTEEDRVVEEVGFSDPEDEKLISFIFSQLNKPLRVRLSAGGSYYQEFELSPWQKRQIRDAWLLSRFLRRQD